MNVLGFFRRKRSIPVLPEIENKPLWDKLVDRVQTRIRDVAETANPFEQMQNVVEEELRALVEEPKAQIDSKLVASINALPERQRAVLSDHLDGLTYRQIAEKYGVSHRTALRDLQRAYSFIRISMNEEQQ